MSDIILDNLGLGASYYILKNLSMKSSEILNDTESVCWQQLLTAIILWDDMFYLPNRGSITMGINDYHILGVKKLAGDGAFDGYYSVYDIKAEDALSPFEFRSPYYETVEAYAVAGSLYHSDVLLHPSRKSNFEVYDNEKAFNALKLLDYLDEQAKKCIEKINTELKMNVYIDIPLLYGYLKRNADTIGDEYTAAKELHSQKDVILFREEIDKLKATTDFTKIYRAANQVKEIINGIIKNNKGASKKSIKTKLSVGLTPKFNPENDILQNLTQSFFIKAEKEWNQEKPDKAEFNFIFLENISDFGLRGESMPILS